MDKAFCPACGIHVEIIHMTVGVGVAAEEVPRCVNCGFVLSTETPDSRKVMYQRVAIAEDQEPVRSAVRDALVQHRMAAVVDEFEDGGKLIQAIQAFAGQGRIYDLVVLDLNMPVINGLQAANFLRALEKQKGWADTPILFFSAMLCDAKLRQQIQTLAPSSYLNKGTIGSREQLPERLSRVLMAYPVSQL